MEPYLVSARKYRPATFASVVGQQALTSTLKNAVASGRLAHSYLFCGSRGVGKTSCARIFAKTINCQHTTADGEACNECESCRAFNAGTSMNIIELDAASNNGVDAMKELIDQVQVPPVTGRYRVFIIDEVHMLSTAAFNAFLKTLEEPPEYVVFILATTEKHKIIPTILSRCQIYDFHRITVGDIVAHLRSVAQAEGIEAEDEALGVIAGKADGAMRDALSIFDQVAASSRGHITYASAIENLNILDRSYYLRLLDMFKKGEVLETWMVYRDIRERGFESQFFINGLGQFFRDLMMATATGSLKFIETDENTARLMAEAVKGCSPQFLIGAMNLCNDADLNFRTASNKQFLIELTLAKLCQLFQPSGPSVDDSTGKGQPLAPIAVTKSSATSPSATATAPSPAQQATQPLPKVNPQAAPQSTPQPASQPTQPAATVHRVSSPSAQSQTAPPRSGVAGVPRISIRGARQESATQVQSAAATGPRRERPFTDKELDDAWDAFINTFPKERILVNTMRMARPQSTDVAGQYQLTVENDIQQATLHENMMRMESFIRDRLENDHVAFTVSINQGESAPHTWSDREVVARMIENNPTLQRFISTFHLTF